MTPKAIIEKLPGSWKEMKLKHWQQLQAIDTRMEDETDNQYADLYLTYDMIMILSGADLEAVKKFGVGDMNAVNQKLAFMHTQPVPDKKSSIQWKNLEDTTYGDYVTMVTLAKDLDKTPQNIPTIIKSFSKVKLTDEQLGNISVQDFTTGFFLLRKTVQQYLTSSIQSTAWKLLGQLTREKVKGFLIMPGNKGKSTRASAKK